MADHIPFVKSQKDCELVRKFYADSKFVRLLWDDVERLKPLLPAGIKLWVDPGFDSLFHDPPESGRQMLPRFTKCINQHISIADDRSVRRSDAGEIKVFVSQLLDECNQHNPAALTIPQWPITNDIKYNKLNNALAAATADWKASADFSGKLILPAIFTHQKQLNKKTERNKKLSVLKSCYEKSQANGIWVVDSSLSDQDGSVTLRDTRLPGIINFHEELNAVIPRDALTIAGPYWGLNLVLWAKGLCRFPAICVGSAYKYYIPDRRFIPRKDAPKIRLALPVLRRWASRSNLNQWLADAIDTLKGKHIVCEDLKKLKSDFSILSNKDACRVQIADFYKQWLNEIEKVPPAGRAPALYQSLSLAYAIGKSLPPLPKEKGVARHPERVAENLMLNCL